MSLSMQEWFAVTPRGMTPRPQREEEDIPVNIQREEDAASVKPLPLDDLDPREDEDVCSTALVPMFGTLPAHSGWYKDPRGASSSSSSSSSWVGWFHSPTDSPRSKAVLPSFGTYRELALTSSPSPPMHGHRSASSWESKRGAMEWVMVHGPFREEQINRAFETAQSIAVKEQLSDTFVPINLQSPREDGMVLCMNHQAAIEYRTIESSKPRVVVPLPTAMDIVLRQTLAVMKLQSAVRFWISRKNAMSPVLGTVQGHTGWYRDFKTKHIAWCSISHDVEGAEAWSLVYGPCSLSEIEVRFHVFEILPLLTAASSSC